MADPHPTGPAASEPDVAAGAQGGSQSGPQTRGVAEPRPLAEPAVAPSWWAGKAFFWWPWPFLVALDLWSKAWVFDLMAERHPGIREEMRPPLLVFDGPLRFELVTWGNTGTIWGLFQNGTVVLMVLRCAAVFGLLWFARSTPRTARFQQLVLSLIFAGAVGNLYDNFVRADRSVRDFLHFTGTWPFAWDFPAFNVADSCITIGALALFLLMWRDDRAPKPERVS